MFFRLFADCKLVKGESEDLIYDLSRGKMYPVSRELTEIIEFLDLNPISSIDKKYPINQWKSINNFLNFLKKNEIGFYHDSPDQFNSDIRQQQSPYLLDSLAIEITNKFGFNIDEIKKILNYNICTLSIILRKNFSLNEIVHIFETINVSSVIYVEIWIESNKINYKKIMDVLKPSRLSAIFEFSQNENRQLKYCNTYVYRLDSNLIDYYLEVDPRINFVTNKHVYSESQIYNTALYKHAFINENGEIMNSLGHSKKFGNINEIDLVSIISSSEFQAIWYISNDKIKKCRTCQFRYCCLDKAEVVKEGETYLKVTECNFNVLKNKWNEKNYS